MLKTCIAFSKSTAQAEQQDHNLWIRPLFHNMESRWTLQTFGKLRRHVLCRENAGTGFTVGFRLLVGRYDTYAVGNEDVQYAARDVTS
jgi:hypothetical protein